jgi:hypothetical protein
MMGGVGANEDPVATNCKPALARECEEYTIWIFLEE